jgi:glycosyltransferase involved in cell wall biosynthesis
LLEESRRRIKRSAVFDAASYPASSGIISVINEADFDLVHLHWINGMLSILEIAQINKPIVWTLHDMWPFLGNQHYTEESEWVTGYQSRADDDPERIAWEMKSKLWRQPFHIVGPSAWITRCAQKSALTSGWPSTLIPYPLCVSTWNPADPMYARMSMGLPSDKILVLYGAVGGTRDPRKGFDLLLSALQYLPSHLTAKILLVVFGESDLPNRVDSNFPIHFFGPIQDDSTLRLIYSSSDVVVVPSRLEAFGQVALEAQACGAPVVAFDNSGLSDVIAHKITGYLAQAFDVKDLATGIEWGVDVKANQKLQLQARCLERVNAKFSNEVVGNQYAKLYRELIELNN